MINALDHQIIDRHFSIGVSKGLTSFTAYPINLTLFYIICILFFISICPSSAASKSHVGRSFDFQKTRIERLVSEGRLLQALPLARQHQAAAKKKFGVNSLEFGDISRTLGIILLGLRQPRPAESAFKAALTAREAASKPRSLEVGESLVDLAEFYRNVDRDIEAKAFFEKAWSHEFAASRYSGAAKYTIDILKIWYLNDGEYRKAERVILAAISLNEQSKTIELADLLGALGAVYQAQGRADEARSVYKRSLEIQEGLLTQDHPDIAITLSNLGAVFMQTGDLAAAEEAYRRCLKIREATYGRTSPLTAMALDNVAEVLVTLGRLDAAKNLYLRALEINRKGNHARGIAINSLHLARLHLQRGELKAAADRYAESLKANSVVYGDRSPELSGALIGLATVHAKRGEWSASAKFAERAIEIAVRKDRAGTIFDRSERLAEIADAGDAFRIKLLAYSNAAQVRDNMEEGFKLAQWSIGSRASLALAQMADRFASGTGDTARLLKKAQDLRAERKKLEAAALSALTADDAMRLRATRDQLFQLERTISDIDLRIKTENPGLFRMFDVEPLSIERARDLLAVDEALLFFVSEPTVSFDEANFVWVVTREASRWVRVPLGTTALTDKVQALRCGLDSEEWEGISRPARCGRLLEMRMRPRLSDPLPFDLGIAHELYRDLLSPVEDLIKDKHLLIVPSGPLTSLPFQVLVTEQPQSARPKTFEGYKGVAWLGRRQPLTVLPSVASLQALRKYAKTSTAEKPYLGYGNPVLLGDGSCRSPIATQACTRIVTASVSGPIPSRERSDVRSGSIDSAYRRGAGQEAVMAEVRALCPLPDTAFELRCVAKSLGVPESELRLGPSSTEADIKRLSEANELENYRVLHFATHGLLADDTEALARRQGEPALVMTPPDRPKDGDDDGLLTASEIAQLRLNADWVILSACNTAAGDKPGAEALSGLARAFFYAGARALLVSHWPVYSDAAVQLLDRTFAELRQDKTMGRSEALRRAMVDLMDDPRQEDNPHPSIWAPFSLAGEGAQ